MKATIGIEVHAELKTKSKMFCGCKNNPHESQPNQNICPVCLAHPGTLPSVNADAVKKVLMVGAALGGKLADFSEFDRKNYFYPDIPKAYQLSQLAYPLVTRGTLSGVAITRVHLEEDTARSQHSTNSSAVDFNRAGVPLMELVTEPVIHSAEEAGSFAKELQLLLRTLGVSDANMDKGEMRVEANISISATEELGTKVEVKNLNSFKILESAIKYEVSRQTEKLKSGEKVVQETRGWDESKARTFSQRVKESPDDYRYFPDPDIPKYQLSEIDELSSSAVSATLPALPTQLREKYQSLGLTALQSEALVADFRLKPFFESLLERVGTDEKLVKLAANYLTSDTRALLGEDNKALELSAVQSFVVLMTMLKDQEINSRIAKDILPEVLFANVRAREAVAERGLLQQNSTEDLLPIVNEVIAQNPDVVEEYKAGKEASLKYLLGQAMKATKGSANPQLLTELLVRELSK
ncbi:Asp-tRNA(Asn)/Glu-tRNA(Gln) amidotransferase GatCAB subunit B [bacterium]|nr:Asp-tRNA(Asn)/Glu-tRNA(Gln) amidotransferase GatCAB subunit B [bacterium]